MSFFLSFVAFDGWNSPQRIQRGDMLVGNPMIMTHVLKLGIMKLGRYPWVGIFRAGLLVLLAMRGFSWTCLLGNLY